MSIALGAVALVLLPVRRLAVPGAAMSGASRSRCRRLAQPPWRWPVERLIGLVVLNAALAIGVYVGYRAG